MNTKHKTKKTKTPTLDRLVAEKLIWINGQEYFGKASDGTEVCFGVTGMSEAEIETYLADHSSPETW